VALCCQFYTIIQYNLLILLYTVTKENIAVALIFQWLPKQEIGSAFLFKGLVLRTYYLGADSATKKNLCCRCRPAQRLRMARGYQVGFFLLFIIIFIKDYVVLKRISMPLQDYLVR
jgi:hypothetical protein